MLFLVRCCTVARIGCTACVSIIVLSDAGNTCGGTGGGASCVFPFTYRGKSYSQCTTVDRKQSWRATQSGDVGSHNKWGHCICNSSTVICSTMPCLYCNYYIAFIVGKIGQNQTAYIPQWEQYTWLFSSEIDNGVLREVVLIKKANETSLRVSWHGNIRIQGCTHCCSRWFFTIDGKECSSPQSIDAIVYQV